MAIANEIAGTNINKQTKEKKSLVFQGKKSATLLEPHMVRDTERHW